MHNLLLTDHQLLRNHYILCTCNVSADTAVEKFTLRLFLKLITSEQSISKIKCIANFSLMLSQAILEKKIV